MTSRRRVVDVPVAGKLIGLLSMLPPALPVALAGERAESACGAAAHAERERDVDVGEGIRHSLRMLFRAAGGEHHRGRRSSETMGDVDEARFRDAGDLFDPFGPIGRRSPPGVVEAFGARRDVPFVDQPIANQHVEQAVGQRRI